MMMNYKALKEKIFVKNNLSSSEDRREILTSKMKKLAQEGKDCSRCNGMCCTSAYNSVQTTPLESLEVLAYLEQNARLNQNLISKINQCIQSYRLDKEISIGKGRVLRKTYTCPFFEEGARGCTIGLNHKPYGCLGFNPLEAEVSIEGKCSVYKRTHLMREDKFKLIENKVNNLIREELGLNWEKLPMPVAIVKLMDAVRK